MCLSLKCSTRVLHGLETATSFHRHFTWGLTARMSCRTSADDLVLTCDVPRIQKVCSDASGFPCWCVRRVETKSGSWLCRGSSTMRSRPAYTSPLICVSRSGAKCNVRTPCLVHCKACGYRINLRMSKRVAYHLMQRPFRGASRLATRPSSSSS